MTRRGLFGLIAGALATPFLPAPKLTWKSRLWTVPSRIRVTRELLEDRHGLLGADWINDATYHTWSGIDRDIMASMIEDGRKPLPPSVAKRSEG